MSHEIHRGMARKDIAVAIVTISTSRFKMKFDGKDFKDESGDELEIGLKEKGYRVVLRELIPDDVAQIRRMLLEFRSIDDLDVIILCGGTGMASKDLTIEAVEPLLEKRMDGFSELFRMVSYQDVGTAAMLTRAIAGKICNKLVFCIPGSPNAARTFVRIFSDELPHAIHMVRS